MVARYRQSKANFAAASYIGICAPCNFGKPVSIKTVAASLQEYGAVAALIFFLAAPVQLCHVEHSRLGNATMAHERHHFYTAMAHKLYVHGANVLAPTDTHSDRCTYNTNIFLGEGC